MKRYLIALLLCLYAQAAIDVVDDAGRHVQFDRPAQRIVSLSPHATELLFSIGLGSRLVGRDGASDFPATARQLRTVGQYGAFNVEAIVALKPDLVIAWEGTQAGPITRRLRELGIPVYASQPGTVSQISSALRAFGQLGGNVRQANRIADQFDADWLALSRKYQHRLVLKVIPQVGHEPAMTVNDQQFVAAVFRACGTKNPFGSEIAPVPLLSAESLLASKPDAIVALVSDTSATRWFERWRDLGLKTAYLAVEPNTLGRPSLRLLPAAISLCKRLDALRSNSAAKID